MGQPLLFMSQKITEQTFYKYLKCPTWLTRELQAGVDIREPLIRKLQNEGLLGITELELIKDKKVDTVDLDDIDEAAQRTAELMREGAQTIYKGALIYQNWVGSPDILERVEGKSNLGNWYYIACDIKRSKYLKDEYKFQGAFYAEILERLQGIRPVQGYVMRSDGSIEGYLIDEIYKDFRLALDDIEEILNGKKPVHFLTSNCKQSPWFSECELETRECDDLSLINKVWRSEVDVIRAAGINSVSELANASSHQLGIVSGITKDRLNFLQLQATALKDNRVLKLAPVNFPNDPGPSLVIDIESDPLRDVDYMIGVLLVEGESVEYIDITARDPANEKRMWEEFLHFMQKYPNAYIYHYGWYEIDVFRKLVAKYGAPDSTVHQFETKMIDVLTTFRESVIFPMPFYSLKDIAKHLGFKWRHKDASGLNSVLWYHDWIEKGDQNALKDIIEYNEDDVRATWFLVEWARKSD